MNRTLCEINKGLVEKMALMDKIAKMLSGDGRTLASPLFPMVFIRAKLVVGLDCLIVIHISGELIPILKMTAVFWL